MDGSIKFLEQSHAIPDSSRHVLGKFIKFGVHYFISFKVGSVQSWWDPQKLPPRSCCEQVKTLRDVKIVEIGEFESAVSVHYKKRRCIMTIEVLV